MRKTIAILGLAALQIAILTGCNTVKGVGQDIQRGAQAVQEAIDYEMKQSQQW